MSELTVAAKLRMVAKGVYTNGDVVLADRFARLAFESDVERVNLTERVKELEEALQDVIDGYPPHDLVNQTGLSLERCTEIFELSGLGKGQ